MNAPIRRLFGLVVVLFAVLVVRHLVVDGRAAPSGCATTRCNTRQLLEEQRRSSAGTIRRRDGTRARALGQAPRATPTRARYPPDSCSATRSATRSRRLGQRRARALAQRRADGRRRRASTRSSTSCRASSSEGDDLVTTLDPAAQQRRAASSSPAARASVVALEPRDRRGEGHGLGPGYDPNRLRGPGLQAAATATRTRRWSTARPSSATRRARRSRSSPPPPRSTRASSRRTRRVNGDSPKVISGVPLRNDGSESFGDDHLTTALTHSVNTVFGQIGEKLGKATMAKYMERFGFDRKPQLDYPDDQMSAVGRVLATGGCSRRRRARSTSGAWRSARTSSQVTPLQMARSRRGRQRRRADASRTSTTQSSTPTAARSRRSSRRRQARGDEARRPRPR